MIALLVLVLRLGFPHLQLDKAYISFRLGPVVALQLGPDCAMLTMAGSSSRTYQSGESYRRIPGVPIMPQTLYGPGRS